MKVHFIAIGGAVMHNLAIALHLKGFEVTGSDDEIFDPARSRLSKYGLLPDSEGWYPAKITKDIDTIILGMHAREDNPELKKARESGLSIMSFPEYLYEQTKNKKRIVVGGSHGKTTITALIMHVLKHCGVAFDYMVGSAIDGFETTVGLTEESNLAVFEGDEYLTSTLDRRPKFHLYHPDIAIINGIAWDHVNVFPDFKDYVEQFRIFTEKITHGGELIYFIEDPLVADIASSAREDIKKTGYSVHGYFQNARGFFAATESRVVPLLIFGEHNMQNLSAAKAACLSAGITQDQFYEAARSFKGTARRLQLIAEENGNAVYLDFAHAPSKVKATVDAVSERYPGYRIIACFELHTFSSLSAGFLDQYKGTMKSATRAFIYFNPHAIQLKRLPVIEKSRVESSFEGINILAINDSYELLAALKKEKGEKTIFLMMSSGDFNGTDISELARDLVSSGTN